MKRHYFVVHSLDDVKKIEAILLKEGIPALQVHTLSRSDTELEVHHLRPVADFMKTDVIHRGLQGFILGVALAAVILVLTTQLQWYQYAGWAPFVFLSVVILGFCTWEGGFLGFQQQNRRFTRFQPDLLNEKYVIFVDVSDQQEWLLRNALDACSDLGTAGFGKAMPDWVVKGQRRLLEFVRWAP